MVTAKKAVEIINGSFNYECLGTILSITPCDDKEKLDVENSFDVDLSLIDEEIMKKILKTCP